MSVKEDETLIDTALRETKSIIHKRSIKHNVDIEARLLKKLTKLFYELEKRSVGDLKEPQTINNEQVSLAENTQTRGAVTGLVKADGGNGNKRKYL